MDRFACLLANRDQYNQTKRIKQAHLLRADYYTAVGDARRAKVYRDSLISIYKQSEADYTSGYIARAMQWYDNEKIADREAKLQTGRIRLTYISILALFSLVVTGVILSLYRKKNAAYKALVQKAEEWAHLSASICLSEDADNAAARNPSEPLTEKEKKLMSLIEEEMTGRCAYRETELTAEILAERLGIHRNALSKAINKATGGNFSQYINGYRIKEAVRIISETDRGRLHIGELYERVGFTNRSTFYRTFKQFTGISPIDFQKNKGAEQGF